MKNALFVSCTDLHFTSKRPACRSDDYQRTMLKKFKQILDVAKNTELKLLLCAGDFFDSAKRNISFSLLSDLISLISNYPEVTIITVPGNHDLIYHNPNIDDIPLRVLEESCNNFEVCHNEKIRVTPDYSGHSYDIFCEGWGWKFDDLRDLVSNSTDNNSVKILLTHTTIFEKESPNWADPVNSWEAIEFINEINELINFDVVISGDNHESFKVYHNGTLLVNSGSMMRSKIDLMEYKPAYGVYYYLGHPNRKCFDVEFTSFEIESDVFNMEYVNEQKEIKRATNLDFDKFLSEVNSAVSITLDYPTALRHVVKKNYPELKEKLEFLLENAQML